MATDDFFRARPDAMINLKHPLAVLSKRLRGDDLRGAYDREFGGGVAPAVATRASASWPAYGTRRTASK